jgi:hypothetical protein
MGKSCCVCGLSNGDCTTIRYGLDVKYCHNDCLPKLPESGECSVCDNKSIPKYNVTCINSLTYCCSEKCQIKFKTSALHKTCEICKTHNDKMYLCSKCKGVYYCSQNCQKQDWKRHKQNCDISYIDSDITKFYCYECKRRIIHPIIIFAEKMKKIVTCGFCRFDLDKHKCCICDNTAKILSASQNPEINYLKTFCSETCENKNYGFEKTFLQIKEVCVALSDSFLWLGKQFILHKYSDEESIKENLATFYCYNKNVKQISNLHAIFHSASAILFIELFKQGVYRKLELEPQYEEIKFEHFVFCIIKSLYMYMEIPKNIRSTVPPPNKFREICSGDDLQIQSEASDYINYVRSIPMQLFELQSGVNLHSNEVFCTMDILS